VLAEFLAHDHDHRPHQRRQHLPPNHTADQVIDPTARIHRKQMLAGLINEYRRAA
jgi:putative transposase